MVLIKYQQENTLIPTPIQYRQETVLQKYIFTGNTKKKILFKDEKILSDCCEALIGALYIDRGFDYVKNFILQIWKKNIDNRRKKKTLQNFRPHSARTKQGGSYRYCRDNYRYYAVTQRLSDQCQY